MTDIELPYTATFNAIGDAVEQSANGIGISVKKFQAAFQPTLQAIVSQACAAEIEAAREEGRREVLALIDKMSGWRGYGAEFATAIRAKLAESTHAPR